MSVCGALWGAPLNCREATQRMAESPRIAAQAELQRHLSTCDACRELAALFPVAGSEMPSAARIAAIQADLTRNWKPVRPLPGAGAQAALLWFLYAAIAVAAAAMIGFYGLSAMPLWQSVTYNGAFAGVAALVAFVAVQRLNPGMLALVPGTRASLFAAALLAGLVPLLFPNFDVRLFPRGVSCLETGSVVAAGASLLFAFALRRTFASRPVGAGAAVGFLAGLCGATALALHCPVLDTPHILVWHFAVLVISSGAGAIAGFIIDAVTASRLPRAHVA